jgi:hypothetical protein
MLAQTSPAGGHKMIDKAIKSDNPIVAGGLICCALALSAVSVTFFWTKWGRNLWWELWIEPNVGTFVR